MLLQTRHINKQFNGIYAVKDVDLEIRSGEILGLVGENGAGKSTIIKLLTGVYSLDSGEILWDGKPAEIRNPKQSVDLGIHVIHQDRQLVPAFSGYENCYLGLPYVVGRSGKIDWKAMRERVDGLAKEYGISLNFQVPAARLSPSEQTMVSILHALMTDCRLLILDEPTASLTDRETTILFEIIRRLSGEGISVLYVSHRMEEIMMLTDRVTVMKNGEISGILKTAEISKEDLIRSMTDQWSSQSFSRNETKGETILQVSHLESVDGRVRDMSLEVHRGEILGVFGLGGSGRTEFLETVYGYRRMKSGDIFVKGERVVRPQPAQSVDRGMVLICEDRRKMALVMPFTIRKNITLSVMRKYASGGVIRDRNEGRGADESIEALGIKCTGNRQHMRELSGGNQQKVVFAKALQSDPEIFLCDEPTQAVDVKTRQEIHRLLRERADSGCAVVFVSSDLKELLETADRIQVVAGGRTKEIFENCGLTSEQILSCCYRQDMEARE